MKRIKKNFFHNLLLAVSLAISLIWLTGCDSGSDGDSGLGDVGDNDRNVVVALGDSITEGECVPAGDPYPARVASASGKTVINAGKCGERTAGGAARVGGLLEKHKPGALLVLYGANDVIKGSDPADSIENLRAIIRAGKANQTRVFVANLLPMYDDHGGFQAGVAALTLRINQAVGEEGAVLINLAAAFGLNRDLIQADGLHPSDDGTRIIAALFAERF